jgi:FkbM family methyltransferase
MKFLEFLKIKRLPSRMQKRVMAYSLKKMFGCSINNIEKEANQLLRFLAKEDSRIITISENEITWELIIAKQKIKAITRRYPSSDVGILNQVVGNSEYGPAIELLKKIKGETSSVRILDAGANVGFASLNFKAYFPKAEIICLEIDDANYKQLTKNIALNDMKSILALNHALWKKESFLEIKSDFRDQSECSYYVEESKTITNLKGFSLEDFMKQKNWDFIDLLKIDIEGGERYLFESNEEADKILSKTHLIALEIHDEYGIRPSIINHFERNRFKHFNHGDLTIAYSERI